MSTKGGNAKNGKDRDTLTYFTARERKMPETAKIEIPVLVAAKDGITKMVDQIL